MNDFYFVHIFLYFQGLYNKCLSLLQLEKTFTRRCSLRGWGVWFKERRLEGQVGAPLGRAREFEFSSERSGKVTKPKSVLDFSSASQNHHETPVLPVLSYWVPSSSDPSSTVPWSHSFSQALTHLAWVLPSLLFGFLTPITSSSVRDGHSEPSQRPLCPDYPCTSYSSPDRALA